MATVTAATARVTGSGNDEVVVTVATDDPSLPRGQMLTRLPRAHAAAKLVAVAATAMAEGLTGMSFDPAPGAVAAAWRRLSTLDALAEVTGSPLWTARAALTDALWDLQCRAAGLPLWKLLVDRTPAELAADVVLHGVGDVTSTEGVVRLLAPRAAGKVAREADLRRDGIVGLAVIGAAPGEDAGVDTRAADARAAAAAGWSAVRLRLDGSQDGDAAVAHAVRAAVGPQNALAITFDRATAPEALDRRLASLADVRPAWVEGAVADADVAALRAVRAARGARRGTDAPDARARALMQGRTGQVPIAAGAGLGDLVAIKQLLSDSLIDVLRLDVSRLGVTGTLTGLVLAARANLPVSLTGGPGRLSDHVAHLGAVDYVAIGASRDRRTVDVTDWAGATGPGAVQPPLGPGVARSPGSRR